MHVAIAVAVVLMLLILSEWWWRHQNLPGEFSRKFVHITVGSFVAFWPYFLSLNEIKLLSVAFIVMVGLSKYLRIFKAIHSVQRPTMGEFWFALVVGLLAFMHHHPHAYTAALLTMSLADGLAAVIGSRFGNSMRYSVLGSPKTIIGTATFFVVSCAILIHYAATTPLTANAVILPIAALATLLENFSVRGIDNLTVPLFVAGALLLFS